MKVAVKKLEKLFTYAIAIGVPLFYFICYTPYGMDTTDFGFFYGYSWRVVIGQIPFKDFYYINPAAPLFWHALWMKIAPANVSILIGKSVFCLEMLVSSWMGALYLARVFDCKKLLLPVPLLATAGFIWGTHSFPHMPWHTVDGMFFAAASLYAGSVMMPVAAGVLAALAFLSKQSFLFIPLGVFFSLYALGASRAKLFSFTLAVVACLGGFWILFQTMGIWDEFIRMTTQALEPNEAIDAGVLIYLRQLWWQPLIAAAPWGVCKLAKIPFGERCLRPVPMYLFFLTGYYCFRVFTEERWIGCGATWPAFCVVLGGIFVLLPQKTLLSYFQNHKGRFAPFKCASAFAAALLIAWSVGISGGYKVPVFYAVPLLFSLLLLHKLMGGNVKKAVWIMIGCGLIMFRAGYEYPYVFPQRPMPRSSLTFHAGDVYKKASFVYVDQKMFETLRDLKFLRDKYGPNYKTLPGFPMAYFLNDDTPPFPCEWVTDGAIAYDVEPLYQMLLDKKIVVFMEKDQMDVLAPDKDYTRTHYTLPQKVRQNWRVIDETKHFIVLMP